MPENRDAYIQSRLDEIADSCSRTEQAVCDLAKHTAARLDIERDQRERDVRAIHRRVNEVRQEARGRGGKAGGAAGATAGGVLGAAVAWVLDHFARGG